jgi:hypothetical protein
LNACDGAAKCTTQWREEARLFLPTQNNGASLEFSSWQEAIQAKPSEGKHQRVGAERKDSAPMMG